MSGRLSLKRIVLWFFGCLMPLIIPLAGITFGEGRNGPGPPVEAEGARLQPAGDAAGPAQTERGSLFTSKIENRKKIRVIIQDGEKTLSRPVILADGIASRTSIDGLEITEDGYNQSTFIPWKEVRMIQVRKRYAGIGALAGLAAGVAVGLDRGGLAGVIVLGPLYGLAGAIVGSMITRWKTVYSAPGDTRSIPTISLMPTRRGGMAVSFSLSF